MLLFVAVTIAEGSTPVVIFFASVLISKYKRFYCCGCFRFFSCCCNYYRSYTFCSCLRLLFVAVVIAVRSTPVVVFFASALIAVSVVVRLVFVALVFVFCLQI